MLTARLIHTASRIYSPQMRQSVRGSPAHFGRGPPSAPEVPLIALAKQFAENGFDLVVAAEDGELQLTADEIRAYGADVQAVQVDLAEPGGMEQLYSAVLATRRPVVAAALNAGVGRGGPFIDTELADELRVIDLNITSTVRLAKLLLPDMVAREDTKGRPAAEGCPRAGGEAGFRGTHGREEEDRGGLGQDKGTRAREQNPPRQREGGRSPEDGRTGIGGSVLAALTSAELKYESEHSGQQNAQPEHHQPEAVHDADGHDGTACRGQHGIGAARWEEAPEADILADFGLFSVLRPRPLPAVCAGEEVRDQ